MIVPDDDLYLFEAICVIVDLLNRVRNSQQNRNRSCLLHIANTIDDDRFQVVEAARIAFPDHIKTEGSGSARHACCQLWFARTIEHGNWHTLLKHDMGGRRRGSRTCRV